jgi:predicted Rossmann fold nucleotide-binding protein DprA/Smf involved in DNA uptake
MHGSVFKITGRIHRVDGFGRQLSIRNLLTFDDWKSVDKLWKTLKKPAPHLSLMMKSTPASKHIYDPPILLWCKGDKQTTSMTPVLP